MWYNSLHMPKASRPKEETANNSSRFSIPHNVARALLSM